MSITGRILSLIGGIRLLSAFITLILVFVVFTLLTYHSINDNISDKSMARIDVTVRSKPTDALNQWSNRIPRVKTYCNPMTSMALNEELNDITTAIPDLNLTKVFVVIRHGDRGPLRLVRDMSSISCDPFSGFDSSLNNYYNLYKNFISQTKDRLRARKLSVTYPLTPTTFALQLGQLSKSGSVQHLVLGSLLSQIYKNRLNITSKNLKVFTTSYSRTFQSAVAFVYGFLKPKSMTDFNTFPQILTTFGIFFCSSSEFCDKKCKKLENLNKIINDNKRKILSSHPAVMRLLDELKPIIAKNISESRLFESPVALFDGLMAYLCHNHPLPCNDERCVSLEEVKQLISYIDFYGKQLSVSDVFKHTNWLKIYGFFNHLIINIKDIKSKHKFVLFSGHDLTIIALTSALDIYDGSIPPYASRVIFDVYTYKSKDIYLRILFNGKDVTAMTEICRYSPTKCLTFVSKSKIHLIGLKEFEEFISQKFSSFTQTSDYEKSCS